MMGKDVPCLPHSFISTFLTTDYAKGILRENPWLKDVSSLPDGRQAYGSEMRLIKVEMFELERRSLGQYCNNGLQSVGK